MTDLFFVSPVCVVCAPECDTRTLVTVREWNILGGERREGQEDTVPLGCVARNGKK